MLQRIVILSPSPLPQFKIRFQDSFFLFPLSGSATSSSFRLHAAESHARTHAVLTEAPGCVWHLAQLPRRFISQQRMENIFVEMEQDMKM
jgi:hypothetical protein